MNLRNSAARSPSQFLIHLLLPLLVVAVFWPATRNAFVNYDDPTYVVANAAVQKGFSWDRIHWAFTTGHAANWHPLTWLSHMLDFQLFGLKPRGHHLVNVLLHAASTLAAYVALRRLTGATWRSLAVALLFGLHPLRVESVAWIAERKDVLSTFFWMLGLCIYPRWVERAALSRPGAWRFYCLTLLCMALGLMSKPMLVTFPFVLLLLDYWPLNRWRPPHPRVLARLFLEKLPFFALAAISSVVTFLVQRQGGAVKSSEAFPFFIRAENALLSYSLYLGKFLHPVHLAVFYPHPGALPPITIFACAALLSGISAIALWQRDQRPWLIVGWLWYLGTLLPAIGLVQVGTQGMADRYTYIPLVGIAFALVWTLHELATRARLPAWVSAAGAAVLLLTGGALTRAQLRTWQDSETLFRHAVAVTDANAVAHLNLGCALGERGAFNEGIAELQQVLAISPDSDAAHLNLGAILIATGSPDEAAHHLRIAIHADPKRAEAHYWLAEALSQQRHIPDAIAEYQTALTLRPDFAEAHLKLGTIYYALNRNEDALRSFLEFLRLKPDSANAQNNVGSVLFAQGRLDEARPYYQAALRLDPANPDARRNLEELLKAKTAAPPRQGVFTNWQSIIARNPPGQSALRAGGFH